MSLLLLLIFSVFLVPALAALPDVIIRLQTTPSNDEPLELLAKRAQFGSKKDILNGVLVPSPEYDRFLCEHYYIHMDVDKFGNVSLATVPPFQNQQPEENTVMLVPRGECSFERKAYAALRYYGASAIVIYDRLGARYRWNETTNTVIYPLSQVDYECNMGMTTMYNLRLDPPAYNETMLDPLMGMTTMTTTSTSVRNNNYDDDAITSADTTTTTTTAPIIPCNLTESCDSQLCLVTNRIENTSEYPTCCAWDLPVTMPDADDAKDLDTTEIIAVWLTIRQFETIFQHMDLLSYGNIISIESRGGNSYFNFSYIFMWIWGTVVMAAGGWYATETYRHFEMELTAYKESQQQEAMHADPRYQDYHHDGSHHTVREQRDHDLENNGNADSENGKDEKFCDEIEDGNNYDIRSSKVNSSKKKQETKNEKPKGEKMATRKKKKQIRKQEVWSLNSIPPPDRKKKKKKQSKRRNNHDASDSTNPVVDQSSVTSNNRINQEETTIIPARNSGTVTAFEMNHWHVLGFVVMASLTLILLYFFKGLYNVIFVFYGIGGAKSFSKLAFAPFINALTKRLGKSWENALSKPLCYGIDGYTVTILLVPFIWTAVWIWFGITQFRPQSSPFFWLTLDIFGACVCILAAAALKLNSIKIATMLLIAIFVYDVFFVFITPYLTKSGASVMLDVAAGSENPSDEDHCYKYPEDCTGIGFLPMLFMFPTIDDYTDGSIILGLGDIVCKLKIVLSFILGMFIIIYFISESNKAENHDGAVPGFLIAFCARHDEASRLVGAHWPNLGINVPSKWHEGYFFPMMIAYSSGLLLAFIAVILMEQGQPALLYICPLCLATILFLGRKRLKDLWDGAKVFRMADQLITKTERKWGKARMRRFAEQRRRKINTALDVDSGNNNDDMKQPQQHLGNTNKNSKRPLELPPGAKETRVSEELKKNSSFHFIGQPVSRDVCFGYEGHPGTKAYRDAVREVTADRDNSEEYKPEIYKLIKKKLKGRRFFINKNGDSSSSWTEATKLQIRKDIGQAYDTARGGASSVLKEEEFDPLSLPKL